FQSIMLAQSNMVHANKALPRLPKISVESHRPLTAGDEESCPSPIVRKYDENQLMMPQHTASRLPNFQQSRRWAKKYGSDPPPPTPPPKNEQQPEQNPVAESESRILSKREESFEQQRAELRRFPITLPNIEEPANEILRSDSSPIVQEAGLCQPAASNCWKSVKATIFITPRGHMSQKHDIRPQSRQGTPTKAQERRAGSNSNRVAVPSVARSGAFATTSIPRRCVPLPEKPLKAVSTAIDNTYTQHSFDTEKQNWVPTRAAVSPALSLHGPQNDIEFSKDCMDFLKSMDHNRDWLSIPTSGPLAQASHNLLSTQANHIDQEDPYEKISMQTALASAPATPHSRSLEPIPDITITSSSTPRAHMYGAQPPAGQTVGSSGLPLPVSKLGNKSPKLSAFLHKSAHAEEVHAPGNRNVFPGESLLRMPSSASSTSRSFKGPRSAISTDTLAKIEAQVRTNQLSHFDSNRGHFHIHRSSEPTSNGPPSIPPERPLPALPADAITEIQRLSSESSRGFCRTPVHRGPKRSSISTIRILGFTDPEEFISQAADLPQKSRHESSHSTFTLNANIVSPAGGSSAASLKSGSSRSSTRSYMRHSVCGPRAEKVKEKRLRDLASSKSDMIGSTSPDKEPLTRPESLSHVRGTIAVRSLVSRPSIDQLDQFPDVPESRPTSLITPTASRGHSRAQSQLKNSIHTRQLSKASSNNLQPTRHRQILSQSNIFIVVDSDPVTTRFKAGTMSPAPSIGSIRSRSESPHQQMKHGRLPSNWKVATSTQGSPLKNLKNRTSLHSIKSLASASARSSQTGIKKNKRPLRSTTRNTSSSSDESHQRIAQSISNASKHNMTRPKKRRRWNSNDIGHVKTLEHALEFYRSTIMKQEERLRDQAYQIQMMIRVIAPMNRARGVKAPSGLSDIKDHSIAEGIGHCSSCNMNRRPNGARNSKGPKINPGYPTYNTGKVTSDWCHKRSNSTDAISTASASANATDATKGSTDEASMTDPFEYDFSPNDPTTKSENLATATFRPSKIGGANAQNSRTATREKTAGQVSLLSVSTQDCEHRHKHTLSKDSGLKYRTLTQIARSNSRRNSRRNRNGCNDSLDTGIENRRDITRLSVNHVLTSTEQMDRALERF
ncbi:uncharacterized protein A1O9_02087, partial [Exophiala aquamarina CBS 119918]